MFLNADLPSHFYALLRKEHLYDGKYVSGYVPCIVFAVQSVENEALAFHVLLENGAMFWRVPIHMLVHREDAPRLHLSEVELWDAFGTELAVSQFSFLRRRACDVFSGGNVYPGLYICTIDWTGNGWSYEPTQNKCAHLIRLENGCFALMPNNRIRWRDNSFVTKPFTEKPDYVVNSRLFQAEGRWRVEDSNKFFYETPEDKGG